MPYGDTNTGSWVLDPWSGEAVWVPYNLPDKTKKQPATGFDWLNAILTGATNILGSLFPSGINNTNRVPTYPGQYPYQPPPQSGGNNTLILVVLAGVVLYFVTKKN